jgi:hypothetical protein
MEQTSLRLCRGEEGHLRNGRFAGFDGEQVELHVPRYQTFSIHYPKKIILLDNAISISYTYGCLKVNACLSCKL